MFEVGGLMFNPELGTRNAELEARQCRVFEVTDYRSLITDHRPSLRPSPHSAINTILKFCRYSSMGGETEMVNPLCARSEK